jgi:CheY-like chemotaxis protein
MTGSRILVVEDEYIVALDLRMRLKRMGHSEVALAATGEAAITWALSHRPELVLMDVILQGEMDGVETATRIRSGCDARIIFLTAHSDEATRRRITDCKPQGYLVKPFDDDEFQQAITGALVSAPPRA